MSSNWVTVTTLPKGPFAAAVVFFEGFGIGFLGYFCFFDRLIFCLVRFWSKPCIEDARKHHISNELKSSVIHPAHSVHIQKLWLTMNT